MKFSEPKISLGKYEIQNLNDNLKCLKIYDLKIESVTHPYEKSEFIVVDDAVSLLFFDHNYYHQLIDNLGLYEILIEYFPYLKTEFMITKELANLEFYKEKNITSKKYFFDTISRLNFDQSFLRDTSDSEYHKQFEEMYHIYNPDGDKVFHLYSNDLVFKECYFLIDEDIEKEINSNDEWLTHFFVRGHTRRIQVKEKHKDYALTAAKKIKERMLQHISSLKIDSPSRIFISRSGARKRFEFLLEQAIQNNDVEKIKEYESKIYERVSEKEETIEKMFNSLGFVSVCMEELTFAEEVYYANNCTHLAGTNGAGILNCIFAKNDMILIEIFCKDSVFDYSKFMCNENQKYVSIDFRDTDMSIVRFIN